jgi:hypothetical protein
MRDLSCAGCVETASTRGPRSDRTTPQQVLHSNSKTLHHICALTVLQPHGVEVPCSLNPYSTPDHHHTLNPAAHHICYPLPHNLHLLPTTTNTPPCTLHDQTTPHPAPFNPDPHHICAHTVLQPHGVEVPCSLNPYSTPDHHNTLNPAAHHICYPLPHNLHLLPTTTNTPPCSL